jgi:hypothetical protein
MAPRRDIFVGEDDVALWDKAEQLAGDEGLAGFLAEALRSYIQEHGEAVTPPGVAAPNVFPDQLD